MHFLDAATHLKACIPVETLRANFELLMSGEPAAFISSGEMGSVLVTLQLVGSEVTFQISEA
jgi:hypothetical protein